MIKRVMDDKQLTTYLKRKGYDIKSEINLIEGALLEGFEYNILKLKWEK